MVLLHRTEWPPELKIEKPLISISHSIDAITFMAYLSSGEQSRAVMALLLTVFQSYQDHECVVMKGSVQ